MDKKQMKVLFSSEKDDWATPQKLYDLLNERYKFNLDAAASLENHKCDNYYTKEDNGLIQDWGGKTVFINPPYTRQGVKDWVKKSVEEIENNKTITTIVVMLLPCRTDTKWWHDYVMKHAKQIFLIKGRIKFELGKIAQGSAPFPSCIIVFKSNFDHEPQTFGTLVIK
jgi:site-specific DNA-methyltransferase (adenine-specific)